MATTTITESTLTAAQVRVGDHLHYGVHWGKVQSVQATAAGVRIAIGTNSARAFRHGHVFRVRTYGAR